MAYHASRSGLPTSMCIMRHVKADFPESNTTWFRTLPSRVCISLSSQCIDFDICEILALICWKDIRLCQANCPATVVARHDRVQ